MAEILAFNRWSMKEVHVDDAGLRDYVTLSPRLVPRTGGKNFGVRFNKSKTFIVERLMNKIMSSGHKGKKHFKSTGGNITGKSHNAYKIIESVFEALERKTRNNPIAVFVKALENASPREEIVTIEYGGARYPKAVECAPQRRVDITLKLMVQGAYHSSFNKKKSMVDALTDEIMAAYNSSQNSNAILKKLELERQADASR